jgi:hypothetical protein
MQPFAPRSSPFAAPLLLAVALLGMSPSPQAADARLGAQICAVLTTVLPEVQQFSPEAARSRLVAAINMKFQDDADKLREVRSAIDREATAACRKEREGLMQIMRTLSLSEAFDQSW